MIAYIAVGISVLSAIIAIFTLVQARKMPDEILETLDTILKETLEPVNKAVSSAMSEKGMKGASVRQVQAMDRRIAEDILSMQDPMIQAGLEMFPRVKEYIDKNPHLLPQLLPRLQQLQGIEGFKIGDLLGNSNSPLPSATNPHPFGLNEE